MILDGECDMLRWLNFIGIIRFFELVMMLFFGVSGIRLLFVFSGCMWLYWLRMGMLLVLCRIMFRLFSRLFFLVFVLVGLFVLVLLLLYLGLW